MSDPFERPTDQWGLIFYSSGLYRRAHTRQEWAQIADTIAAADQHVRGVLRRTTSVRPGRGIAGPPPLSR